MHKYSRQRIRSARRLIVFGRPFVKRLALCYRTVVLSVSLFVCPVLSVTLVYHRQTVEWNKMKLGTEVGLGLGHTTLYGDAAPPKTVRRRAFQAQSSTLQF